MKKQSLFTAALIALGVISQASAANVVYLTGSTAFRGNVYNALIATGANKIFDAAPDFTSYGGNGTPSSGVYMLFHGNIGGAETYVDCFWSGSEAGIAATAGSTSTTINDGAPLAGVPAIFLVPSETVNPPGNTASGAPTSAELNSTSTQPDLTMADTSQTVSLTKTPALHDFGIVGIVPFTWAKGVNTAPDTAWTNFKNVSHEGLFFEFSSPVAAGFLTGNAADNADTIYLLGRNKGSGTRVNTLLDCGIPLGLQVDQWAVNSTVEANPVSGLYGLTFISSSGFTLTEVGDNGYESGGDVKNALNVDSHGQLDANNSQVIMLGYLGTSDASKLTGGTNNWLTLNGVAESDGAVEQGQYSFWGHEHLYGKNGISLTSPQGQLGTSLATGIEAGLLTGNASPLTLHNSGISTTYMNADKGNGSDSAFPSQ